MSQISQLSKHAVSFTVTAAVTLSPPSLPQLSPVLQQPNHVFCHIILWLVGVVPFSTNRNVFFFCLQTLPACGHFRDKSPFLPFLPCDKSLLYRSSCTRHNKNAMAVFAKKTWRTSFIVNPVLDLACPSTQEVGHPRVSGSPQTGTDSVRTRSVSLIPKSQFRCTEQDWTASKIPAQRALLQE